MFLSLFVFGGRWIGSLVSSAFKKKNNKNISAVYRGKLGRRRDSDRLSQYEEDLALPPPKALHWQYLEMGTIMFAIVLINLKLNFKLISTGALE